MSEVWRIFCEELKAVNANHDLQIYSFVLMQNHFHLIASTPRGNISECMHQLMSRTSRRLTRSGSRINETYAGRHRKTILQDQSYLLNAYKYNYRNPVAAGVCTTVEAYPFSSLQFVIGKTEPAFPLVLDTLFVSDPNGTLNWLNTSPTPEKVAAFKQGLRFQYFKPFKHKVSRKAIVQIGELL